MSYFSIPKSLCLLFRKKNIPRNLEATPSLISLQKVEKIVLEKATLVLKQIRMIMPITRKNINGFSNIYTMIHKKYSSIYMKIFFPISH